MSGIIDPTAILDNVNKIFLFYFVSSALNIQPQTNASPDHNFPLYYLFILYAEETINISQAECGPFDFSGPGLVGGDRETYGDENSFALLFVYGCAISLLYGQVLSFEAVLKYTLSMLTYLCRGMRSS